MQSEILTPCNVWHLSALWAMSHLSSNSVYTQLLLCSIAEDVVLLKLWLLPSKWLMQTASWHCILPPTCQLRSVNASLIQQCWPAAWLKALACSSLPALLRAANAE